MNKKSIQKQDTLEGFSASHTASQWSELLGIPFRILKYYMECESLTIEGIYTRYGYTYQAPELKERKSRMGHQMRNTQQRIYELLLLSGYIGPEDDLDSVLVTTWGKNGQHLVNFKGQKVGVYSYRDGGLRLSSGEGLPLWQLDWEDAKIRLNAKGLWEVHSDTRRLLVGPRVKKEMSEPQQTDYDWIMKKHESSPASDRWEKYDGFGESLTVPAWAQKLGVNRRTLSRYIAKGWTIEEFAEHHNITIKQKQK